jgi:hypothetical protein
VQEFGMANAGVGLLNPLLRLIWWNYWRRRPHPLRAVELSDPLARHIAWIARAGLVTLRQSMVARLQKSTGLSEDDELHLMNDLRAAELTEETLAAALR